MWCLSCGVILLLEKVNWIILMCKMEYYEIIFDIMNWEWIRIFYNIFYSKLLLLIFNVVWGNE